MVPSSTSFTLVKGWCYTMMLVAVVAGSSTLAAKDVNPSSSSEHPLGDNDDGINVPVEWWSWRTSDIWEYLDCTEIIKAGRPVHSRKEWALLRKTYRQVVGSDHSTILPNDDVDGFNVPIISKVTPGKGRGVFTAEDIPQGTLVWTSMHQSAEFQSAHSFRRFLAAISTELACDVLQWAYVMDLKRNGTQRPVMICDLDEGSYMNSVDDGIEANVGCTEGIMEMIDGSCDHGEYALRDIKAGEEILCDYEDFDAPKGWKRFGV